jgi:iron complex outermembrane receptor protein
MNRSRQPNRQTGSVWGVICNQSVLKVLTWLLVSLPHLAYPSDTNTNQAPTDLTALSLESLMEIEVPKVYSASKLEQKSTEAPASVSVVTADQIKRYGYRTLADLLESEQGFNVSDDRNYSFLGTRGVSLGDFNDRLLVLVDGHRVNNNFNDGAFVDEAFILDLDLVDRVEVIRGPGAVLYGNNAFFGVINVITRTGAQLNGFEVSGGYGSFDTYKTRVSYGNLFTNGVELLLSGTYYDSAGEDQLYFPNFDQRISINPQAANNGVAQNMDADKSGSFFGSLGYRDFTLEGAFNHREKVNPTAYFATAFNDSRLRTTDDQGYAALKYAHSFPDDFDLTARLYYDTYYHEIGYPYPPPTFYLEQDYGEWWGTEVQLNKRLWDRHQFSVGAEYRDDFKQETAVTGQMPQSGNRNSEGVYFQGDIALLDKLHFDGGVRYDQYGTFTPALDPRLALIYNPFESSTFKAIYGRAFRAPSFYEITTSSQNLKPEKITSYELVYEQGIGQHLRSSLSGYYNEMKDLLVFNSGTFENFNAETKGMELAFEGFWTNGIRCRASYSLQKTTDHTVNWQMPDSPANLIKLNVSVPVIPDKLFAGLEFQYTSSRDSLATLPGPVTVQGEQAGGFGILNFTLFSQNLVKHLDVSASIHNLLDRQYADPSSQFHGTLDVIPQDGRSFRLNLTYHF